MGAAALLLRRIAVNLLDNSRKYGGRETVHVHITAEKRGGAAAWLYRSAVNEGMNRSPWMIPVLVCNLLAVAAFLIVRDAPQRTRKAA